MSNPYYDKEAVGDDKDLRECYHNSTPNHFCGDILNMIGDVIVTNHCSYPETAKGKKACAKVLANRALE